MSSTQSTDSGPPQTEEISVSDELTIYAAVSGIALSHNSIPIVGIANPINGAMVLLSVGLVLAILLVHIDNRFDTEEAGISTARTLVVLISVYLIGNSINGLFSTTGLNLSGNYQSLLTLAIFVATAIILLLRRFKLSGFDDISLGRHYESEAEWTMRNKNKENLRKGAIFSLPFIYLVIRSPSSATIPIICGFLSAVVVPGIWGNLFLRSDQLEDLESKKAKAVVVYPGCVLIFTVLFGGIEPPW